MLWRCSSRDVHTASRALRSICRLQRSTRDENDPLGSREEPIPPNDSVCTDTRVTRIDVSVVEASECVLLIANLETVAKLGGGHVRRRPDGEPIIHKHLWTLSETKCEGRRDGRGSDDMVAGVTAIARWSRRVV